MRRILSVLVLLVLTAIYCWGLGWIAWGFSRAGGAVGWGLSVGVVILLALTVWVTWREVLFGLAAARLNRLYAPTAPDALSAGEAPMDLDPRVEFEAARTAVQDGDDSWQAHFRLGCAYDALRDRKHAREQIRRAIAVERKQESGQG